MKQPIAPASRGVSRVEKSEVVELLQEMIDRLIADFGFAHVQMAGEAHLNRTTESPWSTSFSGCRGLPKHRLPCGSLSND